MESLYAQRSTAIAFAICWVVAVLLVWTLHRQWWKLRAVRQALWIVPAVMLTTVVLWAISVRAHLAVPTVAFALLSGFGVTAALGLVVALPFSGAVLTVERFVRWIAGRRRRPTHGASESGVRERTASDNAARESSAASTVPSAHVTDDRAHRASPRDDSDAPHVVDRARRSFIVTAAAALPALAVGAAGAGVAASYGRTRFPNVPLSYPGLPEALEGLRILHLSDVHLGYFVGLDELEQTMINARSERPDIVLVTGDLSDDLRLLPDALRMIAALEPRYGTYASIGNHEYYRGIEEVHRAFDAGPIPLLIEEATPIAVGGARIYLTGADDPARTGRFNDARFMRRTVEDSLDGLPSEAFSILMSHRPEGFDVAARHGVDLTLSGHYHGGIQLGLGGRAIIQPFRPDVYYWGHYRKGDSQLYTSGGVGHWFPFRLNCPPEAPVYVLGRA